MNQDSKLVGFSWRAGVSFDDFISLNNSVSSANIVIFFVLQLYLEYHWCKTETMQGPGLTFRGLLKLLEVSQMSHQEKWYDDSLWGKNKTSKGFLQDNNNRA